MAQRSRTARAPLCAAVIAALAAPSLPAVAGPPDAPPGAEATRAEAVVHFDKGLALYDRGAWAAALAEFLHARRLYPLRNAVYQAGLCLENLQRYDDALAQFEAVLREWGEAMPAQVKENVQRKVVEMRGLVGEIAVDGAEPGATVTVDGLGRGEYPLLAPLRVAAGSHLVRVWKTGFQQLEARVTVAGGQTERVSAHLAPLGPSGRVRIAEQAGRALDVLIDGTRAGPSPWEGPLPPGPHMIALRGEGNLGTPPVQILVEVDRTTRLTLAAEELRAALRVEPVPVNASVAIDGVSVGHGVWEGRLHAGAHRIEVTAEGFLPAALDMTLPRGERDERPVRVELRRDPRSSFARRPSRFTLELGAAAALAPLEGGDVANGCSLACSKTPGTGGYAFVRGGDELDFGLGFGLTAGYLAATQSLRGRSTSLTAVGHPSSEAVVAGDSLWIHAALAGAWAGFSFGATVPVHLRLGAGALLGSASDMRSASSATASVEPAGEVHPLYAVFVAPELRVGLFVTRRVEISAGVEMLVALVPSAPRWSSAHDVIIERAAGLREYGTFPAETFAGPILVLAPGISARYAF
jgi:hypothetical protein